jgi:hypothetical protein
MEGVKDILRSSGVSEDPRTLYATDAGDVLTFDGPGGKAAIRLWKWLRMSVARTRHWPVLLGGPGETPNMIWLAHPHPKLTERFAPRVRETLEASAVIRFPDWFEERRRERVQDMEDAGEAPETWFGPEGERPSGDIKPNHGYATPFDGGEPYPTLTYVLVPTQAPWEVPAFLHTGGWNECPSPAEQCAIMKYWHEQYGAVVVAATSSVIEMQGARPPKDRDVALALAREQYEYCPDIVDQGTRTVARLAASLLGGSAWFFWWD